MPSNSVTPEPFMTTVWVEAPEAAEMVSSKLTWAVLAATVLVKVVKTTCSSGRLAGVPATAPQAARQSPTTLARPTRASLVLRSSSASIVARGPTIGNEARGRLVARSGRRYTHQVCARFAGHAGRSVEVQALAACPGDGVPAEPEQPISC